MDWATAILSGVIQGVTEFLPVSSSGHLVLYQSLMNEGTASKESAQELFFNGVLHFGTVIAVLIYFGKEIRVAIGNVLSGKASTAEAWPVTKPQVIKLGFLVLLATLPAIVATVLSSDRIKESFKDPKIVAINFLVLGLILLVTDFWKPGTTTGPTMKWWQALLIGIAQACAALFRGISRSGSTICMSLFVGLERNWAVRFSFMLSIIASVGLGGIGILKAMKDPLRTTWMTSDFLIKTAVATGIAMIVGYLTITPLIAFVKRCKLRYFAIYVWIVAIAFLFFPEQLKAAVQYLRKMM